jgi:DNA primase
MESPAKQIKEKINIVDVVGQYVQLRRAGRTYMARCPFHKEKTASFHVSPERGTYKCFGCGEGGDIFSFVEKIEGVDFATALKQLAEKAGVKLEQTGRFKGKVPKEAEKSERLVEVCEAATEFFMGELAKRKDVGDYLHARGVKDETLALWRIGYAPATWESLTNHLLAQGFAKEDLVDSGLCVRSEKYPDKIFDRFRGRIMFPIAETTGKTIAFSGRYYEAVPGREQDGEPAKYVNSPETLIFKKSRVLYGFDKAAQAIRKIDCILLVEGQFDLILAHQSGLPFTVALSGTALTPEHLHRLGRLSKRLILALDADKAGLKAGLRSAELSLEEGFDVRIPQFPDGKDPADIARENPELLKAAIKTAKTAVEFFLNVLIQSGVSELSYRLEAQKQIVPLIAAMDSSIRREHFIHIASSWLTVNAQAIEEEVVKYLEQKQRTKYYSARSEGGQAPQSVAKTQIEQTPLDRAIALLSKRFSEGKHREELTDLVGKERLALIEQKFAGDEERLMFEFDLLGSDEEAVALGLLQTIERNTIKERIALLQNDLRKGGDTLLLREISSLKRREEELK